MNDETKLGHKWKAMQFSRRVLVCCENCGIVRRKDGKNRPCKGPVGLRELEKSVPI